MLAQGAKEVIVVDYSCPQGTSEYVAANHPAARVISVPGQQTFSNWKARNAGAAVASGDVLVFADADILLADGAIDWLGQHLPPRAFGFFDSKTSRAFNRQGGPRLASNQLKGFHAIPAPAFRRAEGYDEVPEGYAAGSDTDLEERLQMIRLARFPLDSRIIQQVIQHDAPSRTQHHAHPVKTSYAAGLLYRAAKRSLLSMRGKVELPLRVRENLYAAAKRAASSIGPDQPRVSLSFAVNRYPVMMPRQLGFESGVQTVTLHIDIAMQDVLAEIPD